MSNCMYTWNLLLDFLGRISEAYAMQVHLYLQGDRIGDEIKASRHRKA